MQTKHHERFRTLPHTTHRRPHTSLLNLGHYTSHQRPPRTDETEGPASKLARAPTEPSRDFPNRIVGEKAGKFSNRKKERLEEGGLGSISDTKCGRVQWEDMMDSTGPRNIVAIGIQKNTKEHPCKG